MLFILYKDIVGMKGSNASEVFAYHRIYVSTWVSVDVRVLITYESVAAWIK